MSEKFNAKPAEKTPPFVGLVAYAGRMTEFRIFTDVLSGSLYVRLPSGKKASVEKRRDDTYVVME